MDPMLELASRYFDTDRSEHGPIALPDELKNQIEAELKHLARLAAKNKVLTMEQSVQVQQKTLWELRDERAPEILAAVLYANPAIAKSLCQINLRDLCPQFIRDLVQEARKQWQAERTGGRKDRDRPVHELLTKHNYDVHESFPEALELALLEKPAFMEELADLLRAALPFSIVLKKELDEIHASRVQRLPSDPDARNASRVKDVIRMNTNLDRLRALGGNRKLIRKETERLHEVEAEMRATGNQRGNSWFGRKAAKVWSRLTGNSNMASPSRWLRREKEPSWKYPPRRAEEMMLFGLALSGGGIRSATFNLGILQGLADLDLLRRLDYLSGVSGGSHIAGWLGAWIKRQTDGVRRVQRWLSPLRSPTPNTAETYPVQFLRRFSNYLAPRKGFVSADTWSMFSVWLGNTIPNQIVIALLITSLLCLPKLLVAPFNHPKWFQGHDRVWTGLLAILLTAALAVMIGLNLRRFDVEDQTHGREKRGTSRLWNQFGVLTTVVLGFWLLGLLGSGLIFSSAYLDQDLPWLLTFAVICGALLTAHLSSGAWRHFFSYRTEGKPTVRQRAHAGLLIVLFAVVSSLAGLGTLSVIYEHFRHQFWVPLTKLIVDQVMANTFLSTADFNQRLQALVPPVNVGEVVAGQLISIRAVPTKLRGDVVTANTFLPNRAFEEMLSELLPQGPANSVASGQSLAPHVTKHPPPDVIGDSVTANLFLPPRRFEQFLRVLLPVKIFLPSIDRFVPAGMSISFTKALVEAIVFGPAVLIAVFSLVILLQGGLLGRDLPDTRKEWWSRLGATLLIAFAAWVAVSYCALYGPADIRSLIARPPRFWTAVASWLVPTLVGLRWGKSSKTAAYPVEQEEKSTQGREWIQTRLRGWIAWLAPYAFIAGLAMLMSYLLYVGEAWYQLGSDATGRLQLPALYWDGSSTLGVQWWLPVVMLGLAMLLAWRFDINEFSMNHFYRNRLVRCYLGASRDQGTRKPNPFTGFDPEDDFNLSALRVKPPDPRDLKQRDQAYFGPYLIFNTALNLVAGKELAWQERKAASFVFTSLYCGYELARGTGHRKRHFANYGYRPTTEYADPRSLGPSVGSAMAISGAAMNPNMGYHSSPALSFLMALFNVRLGSWLGNPRHETTWERSSPTTGLTYLVNELIGRTNDTSWFINLSDGGHFDNLGLYELIRRRCMYIVVCDAEEDSRFNFQGLGGAIRKCRSDFGVEIRLNPDRLRPVPEPGGDLARSRTHCAVGEIIYSTQVRGKLLYIKTSLTGDEPGDVLEYKLRHSAFPQQSTVNQFFDESQFESYRTLGKHIATVILERAAHSSEALTEGSSWKTAFAEADGEGRTRAASEINAQFMDRMFQYLRAMWYPPTQSSGGKSDEHVKLYAGIVEKFLAARGRKLGTAPRTFFRIPRRPDAEFLSYAMMIELMHQVFRELELETMFDHPHNAGWVRMFREWAENRRFQRVWKAVQDNYDVRFRNFCQKEFFRDQPSWFHRQRAA